MPAFSATNPATMASQAPALNRSKSFVAHQTNSIPTSSLADKPVSTLPSNSYTLRPSSQLESLLTIIRDAKTQRGEFIFYSDRIMFVLRALWKVIASQADSMIFPTPAK